MQIDIQLRGKKKPQKSALWKNTPSLSRLAATFMTLPMGCLIREFKYIFICSL